ncbi:PRC-barrel domain-containing protein [Hymenobacter psoromatis]|uniref:PRC-barrel domain-containing protein n=1 Tax=Hymenobacter psoromatis TaxID=1484116 RepID=UPI001CBC3A19|nr:PRC-barrel domain-containing protein [Hymenobacter psoromatis]
MNPPLLRRLRDLPTFEMVPGDPDPRGWVVRGRDGLPLGTVHELLVDPAARRVLYLDVELAAGLPGLPLPAPHADQHILLPLTAVNLDTEGSSVFVTALSQATVHAYPLFLDFILPAEFEAAMRQALEITGS